MRTGGLEITERALWATGLVLLAAFGAGLSYRRAYSRQALEEFDGRRAAATEADEGGVDVRLWSASRVRAWRKSEATANRGPLAVVRIRRINLRAPVFAGTDELTLNRGAGWIPGTARPGEPGNIGIAGHRDGFFRRLKDLSRGDAIELETLSETAVYRVQEIEIVGPEEVGVLRSRVTPELTLVTCYPFYFAGSAPQRFVVHASLERRLPAASRDNQSPGRKPGH